MSRKEMVEQDVGAQFIAPSSPKMDTSASLGRGRNELRPYISAAVALIMLGIVLLIVILLAVSFGSISIPFPTILQILLNGTHLFHFAQSWDSTTEVIIWQVRMPIVIGAALVGAALAVA